MRKIELFNDQWLFEGTPVSLPHCFNAEDGTQKGYRRGTYRYEKYFGRPQGEEIYLEFSGAAMSARVLLNDVELGVHEGGYSAFRVRLTGQLQDENHLEVFVSNEPNEHVYPQNADFTFYGGIYRDVRLISVPKEHFDLDSFGAPGIEATAEVDLEKKSAKVSVVTRQNAPEVLITVDGISKKAESHDGIARAEFVIENVHLWDGLQDPYLYEATAELKSGDRISTRFGCRKIEIDSERGFFLNGRAYPLHGVSRHQDRPGLGNALTLKEHREDLAMIKEMGANAVRLAHYQQAQEMYDLCDEIGFLVWAEIPYISIHMKDGRANTVSQFTELILQNINHPSIFTWAMSNEITLAGVSDDLLENHRILNDLAKKLDPGRYTSMACLFMLETDSPLLEIPDIMGYNLYFGWYVGEMTENEQWFDTFHKEHPEKKIALTEYGADAVVRLQSPVPEKGDYTESYQAVYHEHMLKILSERPYIWGCFVWNMFEFAAAGRDEAGDPGINHKGLVTFDRETKKDAFYIYKAYWSDEPFVYLCSRRYRERIEAETEIKVYSNRKEVSLFVDGKLFETKSGSYVFTFRVPISGKHFIEAKSGELTDSMEIVKSDCLNPDYFVSKEDVRNWFEEKPEKEAPGNCLSIDSTFNEIQSIPEGAALLEGFMREMAGSIAGGMGAKAKIPPMMMKVIGKISLRRLISQSGAKISAEKLQQFNEELSRIPIPEKNEGASEKASACEDGKTEEKLRLPKEFLIGAATAAHQVEGQNIHSDYWAMEHMKYQAFAEPSLDAVDHYHRYEEDIDFLAGAGLNAYRFSIEWARIEPQEGVFDSAETEHYRKMIAYCRERQVEPIVTLHHFTSPKWLIEKGGWEAESTVGYFARYCGYIAKELGENLRYVVTINEANMGLQVAMIAKRYLKSLIFGRKKTDGKAQVGINLQQVLANMKKSKGENLEVFGTEKLNTFVAQRSGEGDLLVMRAHQAAVKAIKAERPELKVGLSLSLHDIQAEKGGEKKAGKDWENEFLHYLPYIGADDFIGIQNYTRSRYNQKGVMAPPAGAELTQMEYEFYPAALEHVIRRVYEKYKGEILVTENGIATSDDARRIAFIKEAVTGVKRCVADGIPVKGYLHWSLLDNFEWQKGFSMTFGLIAVDRKTQKRYPKESLNVLGGFAKQDDN